MKITRNAAIKLMKSTQGKIFSATFMKKDGTVRAMNCRLGVTKHLKGGSLAFNPAEYDLMTVFDVQKKAYRMIDLDTLKSVRVGGRKFTIQKRRP